MYCDATGHRFWANVIMYVSVLISSIMILVWDISTGAKFFAYIIAGELKLGNLWIRGREVILVTRTIVSRVAGCH